MLPTEQKEIFPIKFTHKQLVEIAYKWVLKNGSVGFAFKEFHSIATEKPDVIGFGSFRSIVIEVKVSRSDFLADKNKPHRSKGMGNWRFYCCPTGLIKKEELPKKWGLIYVDGNGKAKVHYDCRKKIVDFELFGEIHKKQITAVENLFVADGFEEQGLMYTALRRMFIKGHLKHVYDGRYHDSTDMNELIEKNQQD